MHRFFVPASALQSTAVAIPQDVAHHLKTVLRLCPGDEIILLDGAGTLCRCRLEAVAKQSASAHILQRWQEPETAFPIELIQALPKGDKMDLVLQKGTELGIGHFTPALSERSVGALPTGRHAKRLERWDRIIREAARQCRRPILPRLSEPAPLEEALAASRSELRLMLWEEESRPLSLALPEAPPEHAAILVGPEGGFSPGEAAIARNHGFIPVRLGPRILRTETAGFAMASILQFRYGDLNHSP